MTCNVTLPDIDNEKELIQWAITNCKSFAFVFSKRVKTDDTSLFTHFFNFSDEKDAMWFRLTWT